ncbi:hypothetical protein [Planctomicrobium piriforme]|uniref:Uncharacterized protein n=1 Tax=Planctomicrobium piriforme TaxID=1576369 RepID=A0A1I3F0C7_9PLAN|nr:hypothetical protein [Planctomicrobium piriforme]SFI04613.1 hypothetical protein SAMN05421753_10519 [Planctomicrobium piriforme]
MGAEPYWYYVPYEASADQALSKLRQREFEAGRYFPAMEYEELVDLFPTSSQSPAPGPQHSTIDEAIADAAESGTLSILDLDRISDVRDYGAVSKLPDKVVESYYGTTHPTRAMVEENQDYFDDLDRGQGLYIILYKGQQPSEILFAGYSYD